MPEETQEFPDHWLQPYVGRVMERVREDPNMALITLATGKTPSGHIHLGILREIIMCDALRRKLEEIGEDVRYFHFFDSLDAAKKFPGQLGERLGAEHLGKPFSRIPSPYDDIPEADSYAKYFGIELLNSFEAFGIHLIPMWSHELYEEEDLQDKIQEGLEKTEEVKEIVKRYVMPTLDEEKQAQFLETQKTWMPAMVICEKCERTQAREKGGKIIPNRVLSFDPEEKVVTYECPACRYKGRVSTHSGRVKLNWRLDWPAKWTIYRTTLEPAGKDHAVKGGSYDTGLALCREIYGYLGPEKFPYEWLRLGDRDMSTSQGIVFTPKLFLKMGHPELIRMRVLRTNPNKHISFRIEELPQMYDEYERMAAIFYGTEEAESEDVLKEIKYSFPLCQINTDPLPEIMPRNWLPFRFSMLIAQLQGLLGPEKTYDKCVHIMKKLDYPRILTKDEVASDLQRALNWVDWMRKLIDEEKNPAVKKKLARNVTFINVPEKVDDGIREQLSETQKKALKLIVQKFQSDPWDDEDRIQNTIFNVAKEDLDMKPRDLFQAVYLALLGDKMGPRLGPLLISLEKDWVLDRLQAAI